MSNAKFSRDRFNKCDAKGKKWAKGLIERLGASRVMETKRNTKYDMEAIDEGIAVRFEVEIKQDWGTKWKVEKDGDEWVVNGTHSRLPFPFGDIRFAARKKDNPVDYYITFSGCGKYAMVAPSKDVKRSRIKQIDNKHMSGEPFMVFRLSGKSRFAFFKLDEDRWEMIFHWSGREPKVLTLDNVFGERRGSIFDL